MTMTAQPCEFELALQRQAESVQAALKAQDEAWGAGGWTRRRFLAGSGMVGVAALGSQLVTTRAAFGATPTNQDQTMIVVFLRGAADGLHILVPNTAELGLNYLREVRPALVPGAADLIALSGARGWALHSAMAPLHDELWATGELAFVPAVAATGISRSHFQAQQFVEKGGSDSAATGWLDRLLDELGPGTTFRAVADGYTEPAALSGPQRTLVLDSIANFTFPGWDGIRTQSQRAVTALYRGLGGTLGEDVPVTMRALATAKRVQAVTGVQNGAVYPSGGFASSLQDLAAILRAEVGMQVATVDVGGWDTHTSEVSELDGVLTGAAAALAAFMTDLGPTRRQRVTVVVVTEFGRRVEMNASGGTDHGHGSVTWLLGGGVKGGVHGKWTRLGTDGLLYGDVPGHNSIFDILGEVSQKRLKMGGLRHIFPNHRVNPIGVAVSA
jgi:uncharacterized protein (DUF1501 family)